jgi:hypothetical protein
MVMVFNATFNNISIISWQSVLLVEETMIGMVITLQRADMMKYGVSYKVAPMYTEKKLNMNMCFQVNGTNKDDAVMIQSV